MSTSTIGLFIRHLALSEEVKHLKDSSDRDLLAAYQSERSEAAFTELMRRYGPQVLSTCRRVLGAGPDAEDVFQATFILLTRKAGQLSREVEGSLSLGGWLHRVAYRTAVDVLIGMARRKTREQRAIARTLRPSSCADPATLATWNEVQPILDAELDALPEQARRLLIACYLHGKSYTEAAEELGLPRGSIAWHLERARTQLAKRLARRGITVSALMLSVLLEDAAKGAAVPAVLLVHTLEASRTFTAQATGMVSDTVVRLVKGGLAQMAKSSTHYGIMLAGWLGLLGAGLLACQTLKAWPDQAPKNEPPTTAAAEQPAPEREKPPRTDLYGDPLPPRALARMGTVRLNNNGNRMKGASDLLAFSPDGKLLASHIAGMTVALWDTITGKELRRLPADAVQGQITSLGFSPDGKTLITVTQDHKAYLWEAATGKLLRTTGSTEPKREELIPIRRADFLSDGRILTAVDFHKEVELSPGEKRLVYGIYVWDAALGKEVRELSDPNKRRDKPLIASGFAAFSSDGKQLATAEEDSFSLWDVATGKVIRQLNHNADNATKRYVKKLAFSRDGKMLASSDRETVAVWDAATGKLLQRLEAPSNGHIPVLTFSPDGKTLVAGHEGHLWEVTTGKKIRSLGLQDVQVALFSSDGKTLAVGDAAGVIRLWDMATGKEIFPHPGHSRYILAITYSPDGKTLASRGDDEIVHLWEVATGKGLHQLGKPARVPGPIAYSPDGKTLARTEDESVCLWDTATGKEIRQSKFYAGVEGFHTPTFSPDGKKLAARMWDRGQQIVILWEVATGKTIYTLPPQSALGEIGVIQPPIVFSPDGRMLATPGKDNTVSLWEVATGKPVGQLGGLKLPGPRGKDASVRCLAFSPDGRVLATSSSQDDKVRLWEMASGKQIGQLDGYKHCKDREQTWRDGCMVTFSPDGRMLATSVPGRLYSGEDLGVTLWEVASCQEIGRLTGHRSNIRILAFSPDGKTLASGSDDLTCLVWNVAAVAGQLKSDAADSLALKSLTKEQLETAWANLANIDAAKAYQAVAVLRAAPGQAVPLLKERVRPVFPIADPKQLARWIADLDDERFAVRQKAQRVLERLDELAIPAMRQALADQPSLEVKRRLEDILDAVEPKLGTGSPGRLRQIRVVQVLESLATPEARQVLQSLAKGVAEVSLTREAQAALKLVGPTLGI